MSRILCLLPLGQCYGVIHYMDSFLTLKTDMKNCTGPKFSAIYTLGKTEEGDTNDILQGSTWDLGFEIFLKIFLKVLITNAPTCQMAFLH